MKFQIRIALVASPDGRWCAQGSGVGDSNADLMEKVASFMGDGAVRYWIAGEVDPDWNGELFVTRLEDQ